MAHGSAKNLALIRDLCSRLGFSVGTEQLKTENGLRSLLPQIQERLRQMQDQDTYGDVEEIPTDTCPVVYVRPSPFEEDEGDELGVILGSIAESTLSAQLQLMLVAQALALFERLDGTSAGSSSAASGCSESRCVVEASLNPLLTEIRSEALLKEVLMSVVRVASSEARSSGGSARQCCSCRSSVSLPQSCASDASDASNSSRRIRSAPAASAPAHSDSPLTRRRCTLTANSATVASSTSSIPSVSKSSSFSGFPCYQTSGAESGGGSSKRTRQTSTANASSSGHASNSGSSNSREGHGQTVTSSDHWAAGASTAVMRTTSFANSSEGSFLLPPLPQLGTSDELAPYGLDVELSSLSNMEAQWRGRGIPQRRREFCWAVEDAYQDPYDGWAAIARDGWQFMGDRSAFCPAHARLSRSQRASMMAARHRARGAPVPMGESSPLELDNGVTGPFGPSAAPCRTAFLGE